MGLLAGVVGCGGRGRVLGRRRTPRNRGSAPLSAFLFRPGSTSFTLAKVVAAAAEDAAALAGGASFTARSRRISCT